MPNARKLVYLTDHDPEPPTSGGMIRDAQWLKLLSSFSEFEIILTEAHPPSLQHQFSRVWSRFRSYPENGYSQEVETKMKALFTPGAVLIVSRLTHGKYIAIARTMGYKVVLDEHNVEWLLNEQMGQTLAPSLYRNYLNRRLKKIEKLYCTQAD